MAKIKITFLQLLILSLSFCIVSCNLNSSLHAVDHFSYLYLNSYCIVIVVLCFVYCSYAVVLFMCSCILLCHCKFIQNLTSTLLHSCVQSVCAFHKSLPINHYVSCFMLDKLYVLAYLAVLIYSN